MHALPLALAVVTLVQPVHVTLTPVATQRDAAVRVVVSGIDASALQARLLGAQTGSGTAMPWVALARRGTAWRGTVRTPHYWGVYPVQLRTAPAAKPLSSAGWLVKVLPQGFRTRPSFATPTGVAAWWVRTGPPKAVLLSARPWRAPPGTPANAFNRMLDVRFRLLVPWPPVWPKAVTLTMFVSASRERLGGRWRFVDVGTGP